MNSQHFMRLAAFVAAVAIECGIVATGAQAAQTKAFIDLTGGPAPTTGEKSTTKAGWIEISSFSWGVTRGSTAGSAAGGAGAGKVAASIGSASSGAGAGKVTLNALNVTLTNAADEMKLMTAAMDGKIIPSLELADYKVTAKGAMVPIYNVKFTDVIVTSIDWNGKNDKPSANVSLGYKAVEISENQQAPKTEDPVLPAGWNRVNNVTPDLSTVPTP